MNSIAGTGKNRGKTAARDESTLRAGTQDALRNAILDGKFKAGQKLVERELCEFTGASRSILREALVSLEAKGLIEHQSYRGYRVARLSARKIVEIFELRSSLETQAAELFTERASDEEIATLNEALTELERCLVNFDLARMRATKERYYDTLFTGCRNEEIRREASLEDMRRLTSALTSRDRLAARSASLAHLEAARETVLQIMEQDDSETAFRAA
jgi:DNA-binding GntR family transcriptional regulator